MTLVVIPDITHCKRSAPDHPSVRQPQQSSTCKHRRASPGKNRWYKQNNWLWFSQTSSDSHTGSWWHQCVIIQGFLPELKLLCTPMPNTDSVHTLLKCAPHCDFPILTLGSWVLSIFTRWRVDDRLCSSISRMRSSVGNWSSSYRSSWRKLTALKAVPFEFEEKVPFEMCIFESRTSQDSQIIWG